MKNMMARKVFIPVIVAVFLMASVARASEGDAILGSWNTEEHDAVIEIFRCGDSYCGRIAWIKEPNYTAEDRNGKEGQPKVDANNPDPGLRNRPLVGLELMRDFAYAGNNVWKGGKIYDPERGKTYNGFMSLISRNTLHLKGYILIPLFGRTTVWTRAGS
jgi:uncharacterized protein (DUF2147 family)